MLIFSIFFLEKSQYLVICDTQLLTEFEVDEGEVAISKPLATKADPSVFHVCRDIGGMEAVEGFCLTFQE